MRVARFFSVLCLLLCSCSHAQRIESKIVALIHHCDMQPCIIQIDSAMPVAWDHFYYFNDAMSRGDIESVLGTALPQYKELTTQIVLMREGRVVYHETWPTNIEHPLQNEVIFSNFDNKQRNYEVIKSHTHISVSGSGDSNTRYFVLCDATGKILE